MDLRGSKSLPQEQAGTRRALHPRIWSRSPSQVNPTTCVFGSTIAVVRAAAEHVQPSLKHLLANGG